MSNLGYVFAAYTIIWAVLFGYLLTLSAKQRQLRRELETLKSSIKSKKD